MDSWLFLVHYITQNIDNTADKITTVPIIGISTKIYDLARSNEPIKVKDSPTRERSKSMSKYLQPGELVANSSRSLLIPHIDCQSNTSLVDDSPSVEFDFHAASLTPDISISAAPIHRVRSESHVTDDDTTKAAHLIPTSAVYPRSRSTSVASGRAEPTKEEKVLVEQWQESYVCVLQTLLTVCRGDEVTEFVNKQRHRDLLGRLLDQARINNPALPSLSTLTTDLEMHTDGYGFVE